MQVSDVLLLTKQVPLSAYPLLATAAACATAAALSLTRRWRVGVVLLGVTLAALWIAGTPAFSSWLSLRLETEFPVAGVERLPQSDVVILLGGSDPNLDDPANRIMQALRVYRAGKAQLIVVSGGNQLLPNETIADRLLVSGVPRSAVIVENESRNTRENAVNTAAIFRAHGWRSGLLVTSALHMPRAVAAFQRVGLGVVPAATNIETPPHQFDGSFDLEMRKEALLRTTAAIREMIGLLVYRCLGWA